MKLVASATTTKFKAKQTAASTTALDVSVHYAAKTTTAFTPTNARTTISTTANTYTDILAVPAASTQHIISSISIYNADNIAHTVTVAQDDSGTVTIICKMLVPVGSTLVIDENGIQVLPSAGGPTIFYQDATPTANAADDLWYETDTNIWWYWNGTYWLSVQLFTFTSIELGISADSTVGYFAPEISETVQHDLFFVDMTFCYYINGANTGANYYNVIFERRDATSPTPTVTTIETNSTVDRGASVWFTEQFPIGVHVDLSAVTVRAFSITTDEQGTAGTLTGNATVTYRWAHL